MPMSPKQKKEMTIEEGFRFLDESVQKLSEEDLPLEEAFAIYEKGMKVLMEVSGKIEEVEKKVQVINEEGGFHEFE